MSVLLAALALVCVAPAAGPALRPAWLTVPLGGAPLSAWLLLALIVLLLVVVRIISADSFTASRDEETER